MGRGLSLEVECRLDMVGGGGGALKTPSVKTI